MAVTMGELILRRRLEKSDQPGFGTVYQDGQYQATLTGDDGILSYVRDGWAVVMFVTKFNDEWVIKTDRVICANSESFEVRPIARTTVLGEQSIRAIQEATKKRGKKEKKDAGSA